MKTAFLIALVGTAALVPTMCLSAPARLGGPLVDGSVVRVQGCGVHFFVSYKDEYALVEWVGGDFVKEGDVLMAADESSDLEHEGRGTFTNLATGHSIDMVIEKTLMNREDYSLTARKVCR